MTQPYVPHLFISIGLTGAYLTLRETHLNYYANQGNYGNAVVNGVYQGRTEESSHHLFNLSQDADEALRKAQEHAEKTGLVLSTTGDELKEQMREIKRTTAEELERREQARLAAEQEWAQKIEREREGYYQKIAQGIYPLGFYQNQAFREAPVGYINWLIDNKDQFEDEVMADLAAAVEKECADLILPKPDPELTLGKPKQRMELDVIVVRRATFYRQNFFGGFDQVEKVCVITLVDEHFGACVLSMTPSFDAEVGQRFKIKATVKSHDEYKGQAQTRVQRIKILETK